MESLAFYIDKNKFKSFPDLDLVFALRDAVKSVIGVDVKTDQIVVSNGVINLNADPSLKSEVRLKIKAIETEMNKRLLIKRAKTAVIR